MKRKGVHGPMSLPGRHHWGLIGQYTAEQNFQMKGDDVFLLPPLSNLGGAAGFDRPKQGASTETGKNNDFFELSMGDGLEGGGSHGTIKPLRFSIAVFSRNNWA